MSDPFPEIKSTHSLVAKYVTKPLWDKLSSVKTKTSGFTLAKVCNVSILVIKLLFTKTDLVAQWRLFVALRVAMGVVMGGSWPAMHVMTAR